MSSKIPVQSSTNCDESKGPAYSFLERNFNDKEKQYHNQFKEVVTCWKASYTLDSNELQLTINSIQDKIGGNDYTGRSFIMMNPFGQLLYTIEYITACPNASFALSISAAKWTKVADCQNSPTWTIHREDNSDDSGDDEQFCDQHLYKSPHHLPQPSDINGKEFSRESLEALHKMVSTHSIGKAIVDILIHNAKTLSSKAPKREHSILKTLSSKFTFTSNSSPSVPMNDNPLHQIDLHKFRSNLRVQLASDHIAKYFSPQDAEYCEWESGRDDLPTRSVYKLLHTGESIPKSKKAAVVHVIKLDNFLFQFGQFRSRTVEENSRHCICDEPLVAVAWNDSSARTHAILIYKLFSRQVIARIPIVHNDENNSTFAVSGMVSRFIGDEINEFQIFLAIEEHSPKEIKGHIGLLRGSKMRNNDIGIEVSTWEAIKLNMICDVHRGQLSSIRFKNNLLFIGSYDKTFSITDVDNNNFKDSKTTYPMENLATDAFTHVDIILDVVPMSEKGDALFTSSWDTTIRYWKRVIVRNSSNPHETFQKWTSYQFPIEHVKKIGCLAYYESTLGSMNAFGHGLYSGLRVVSEMHSNNFDNAPESDGCSNNCANYGHALRYPDRRYSVANKHIRVLISGCLGGLVIVWDVTNPKKPTVMNRLIGHEAEVIAVKVVFDHLPSVYTSSKDKSIRVWDLLSGTCYRILKHAADPSSIDLLRIITRKSNIDRKPQDDALLGDMVVSAVDNVVTVWNLLSNHRQYGVFTDPVINVTTLSKVLPGTDHEGKQKMETLTFIGTSKSKVTVAFHGTSICEVHVGNKKDSVRVNAIAAFNIAISAQDGHSGDYVVCGMADGQLSILRRNEETCFNQSTFTEILCFNSGMKNIFSVAVYTGNNPTPGSKGDIQAGTVVEVEPVVLVGGMEGDDGNNLQIWKIKELLTNFSEISDPSNHSKFRLPFTSLQGPPVRCVSVYSYRHDDQKTIVPLFITGDYARKAIIWNLEHRRKVIELTGFHTQFIINIDIFDPLRAWQSANGHADKFYHVWKIMSSDEKVIDYNLANYLVVCTGGYDGKIGLWPVSKSLFAPELERYVAQSNDCLYLEHENSTSVTAMTLFLPQGGTDINPLLVTGSIDNLIYVWDIYTRQRLRILTGHHNRINSLATYYVNFQTPLLVSGSDDSSATFWYDSLQHNHFPPTKDMILRTFYSDIFTPGHNWHQMKVIAKLYPNQQIFYEFPQLFFLALMERQESFFIEFVEDLKFVIDRIPLYRRSDSTSRWVYHSPKHDVDILEYAMHTNSLIALRAILRAWSFVLNRDIEDSLQQKVLHANRCFNEHNLFELAVNFPVEYISFIQSLRLVRAHKSVKTVNNRLNRYIPHNKRSIIIGSNDFHSGSLNEKFRSPSRDRWYRQVYDFLIHFQISLVQAQWPSPDLHAQAVMPFMLPVKKFVDLRQFNCLIQASEKLDKVELFDSEVVITSIIHYWNRIGYKLYYLNLFQYACTIGFFVYAIYSYQYVVNKLSSYVVNVNSSNSSVLSSSLSQSVLDDIDNTKYSFMVFIFLMCVYGIDELAQVFGEFWKFHKYSQSKFTTFLSVFINHIFFDLWNTIDCAIVILGILGSLRKVDELDYCRNHDGDCMSTYTNKSIIGSCLLASTAVMLWFKVLYFLVPNKIAGEFVVMVMLIINDIKYFLFVLLCVLTGFAQGFWLLNNDASIQSSNFATAKDSYFTTFMYMFGQISLEDFDESKSKEFAKVFLVAFMLTMMILLFNLLIALMGDSFARTKEHIRAHYWRELTCFMVDQSMTTPLLFLLHIIGWLRYEKDEFVHVVKYASDVDTMDEAAETPLDEAFKAFEGILKVHGAAANIELLSKRLPVDKDIVRRANSTHFRVIQEIPKSPPAT